MDQLQRRGGGLLRCLSQAQVIRVCQLLDGGAAGKWVAQADLVQGWQKCLQGDVEEQWTQGETLFDSDPEWEVSSESCRTTDLL